MTEISNVDGDICQLDQRSLVYIAKTPADHVLVKVYHFLMRQWVKNR